MSVTLPFRLRCRPEAETAALFLPTHDLDEVLRLCGELGLAPEQSVHATADGFLLRLSKPNSCPPGVIRLRALATNLFLPIDAELLPPLLDDEAKALVSRRGLIFLPGEQVLEFSLHPLTMSGLLSGFRVERGAWRSFVEPVQPAEQLREIVLDLPPSVDTVFSSVMGTSSEPIPNEDLDDTPQVQQSLGFKLGSLIESLGNKLNLGSLKQAGKNMMDAARQKFPRSMLDKQQAVLQSLLREFREGNIEKALRRALPLDAGGRYHSSPVTNANLPVHNTSYSLGNVMPAGGEGTRGTWYADPTTFRELEQEYRKHAEAAVQQGDHRRAAFIFAKLLNDFSSAASTLSRGGLHRDAAIIYHTVLHDIPSAAREYEAAGEFDRALELYRRKGDHLEAARLLKRIGEEERARTEFLLAAEAMKRHRREPFEIGEMLYKETGSDDLAFPFFQEGWDRRPSGAYSACGLRLAQHHAERDDAVQLNKLLDAADAFFRSAGTNDCVREFYNGVVRLPGAQHLEKTEYLRERALLGLAGRIRRNLAEGYGPKPSVYALLGEGTLWEANVVADVRHAARCVTTPSEALLGTELHTVYLPASHPIVTAVAHARDSEEIFVAFKSGEVVGYDTRRGKIFNALMLDAPATSLAVSPDGKRLAAMHRDNGGSRISCYAGQGRFEFQRSVHYDFTTNRVLSPTIVGTEGNCYFLADWGADVLHVREFSSLLVRQVFFADDDGMRMVQMFPPGLTGESSGVLTVYHRELHFYPDVRSLKACRVISAGLVPFVPKNSTVRHPQLAWLRSSPTDLELAVLGDQQVRWMQLSMTGGGLTDTAQNRLNFPVPCLAVTLIRPGVAAVVTASGIHWRSLKGPTISVTTTLPGLETTTACFSLPGSNELLIVLGNNKIVRVPNRF